MAGKFSIILVPYDGSKSSDNALEYALALGEMARSRIILLNVVEEIVSRNLTFDKPIKTSKTGEVRNLREYLKELYQELKSTQLSLLERKKKELAHHGVDIDTRVVLGHPVESILRTTIEYGASLIVMGTIGLSGFSKLKALGSVARGVSERAACPVMLVHGTGASK